MMVEVCKGGEVNKMIKSSPKRFKEQMKIVKQIINYQLNGRQEIRD